MARTIQARKDRSGHCMPSLSASLSLVKYAVRQGASERKMKDLAFMEKLIKC